jgi:hypothetical protein
MLKLKTELNKGKPLNTIPVDVTIPDHIGEPVAFLQLVDGIIHVP